MRLKNLLKSGMKKNNKKKNVKGDAQCKSEKNPTVELRMTPR